MPNGNVFQNYEITPRQVHAGETVQFVITLVVGTGYTADPSRLVLDFPGTLGTSRPSRQHQEDLGYIECYVSNPDVGYALNMWDIEPSRFVSREEPASRAARLLVIDLDAGLQEGDQIEIHWGEISRGYGPGTRVTHLVPCPDYENYVHARYFSDQERGVPDYGRDLIDRERPRPDAAVTLQYRVDPLPPCRLHLVRGAVATRLIPLDMFWNVSNKSTPEELLTTPSASEFSQNDHGAYTLRDKDITVTPKSLPMEESASMTDVFDGCNLYWGDIHTHSAVSKDNCERDRMERTADDLMRYAREAAALDFAAVTDHFEPHHNPTTRLTQAQWQQVLDGVCNNDDAGNFLAFPGMEYRCPRGDTAVIFNWYPEFDEVNRPEWSDVSQLWNHLNGKDILTIPHFHNPGTLTDGEWWYCPDESVEPVLELFSCHGSYETAQAMEQGIPIGKKSRHDRFARYMLDRGCKYGLVANSDGHKGAVGNSGLTAVFAPELTKEAILRAYRQRHVYATTNARIRLVFTANGELMGSTLPSTPDKHFRLDVVGENTLKKIELFRDGALYQRFAPGNITFQKEITVTDNTATYWYARVTQADNQIAWSSPVWFEDA